MLENFEKNVLQHEPGSSFFILIWITFPQILESLEKIKGKFPSRCQGDGKKVSGNVEREHDYRLLLRVTTGNSRRSE